MQNTSHAVMAQRTEARDSLDDFPTPPWATRALCEHVISIRGQTTIWEPACGRGHMAKTLKEYAATVHASDVHDYGYGEVLNFLPRPWRPGTDWIITNPPFRLAERFIHRGLEVVRQGVAILVRSVFIESVGRHDRLFVTHPPSIMAQFAERVPMVKGRLDKNASTATSYCWLVWRYGAEPITRLMWIPPCRTKLERAGDYD